MNIISKKYQPKRYEPTTNTKSIEELKSLLLGKKYNMPTQKESFEMSPKAKYFRPELSSNNLKVKEFSYDGNTNIYDVQKQSMLENTSRLTELKIFEYKPLPLNNDTSEFKIDTNSTTVDIDYFANNTIDFVPIKINDFGTLNNSSTISTNTFTGNQNVSIQDVNELSIKSNQSISEVYSWDYTNLLIDNRPNVMKFVNDNNLELPANVLVFNEKSNDTVITLSDFKASLNIVNQNISEVNIPTNDTIINLQNFESDDNLTITNIATPTLGTNSSVVTLLYNTISQNNSIVEITDYNNQNSNDSIIEIQYHTPILNNVLNANKFIEIGFNIAKGKLLKQILEKNNDIVINNIPTLKPYSKTENNSIITDNKDAKLFDILEWYNDAIQKKQFDNNHNSAAIQFSNIGDVVGTNNFTKYVSNADAKSYYESVNNIKSTLANKYSLPSGYTNVRNVNQRNDTAIDKITNLGVGEDYGNLEDLIPFKFQNYEKTDTLIFRATLSGLSDSFAGSWDEVEYIGRSDKSYQYNSFERSIGFGFVVMIGSKHEFKTVWKKLNHLAKYTTPKYINNRKTGNLMRLTIGDLWQNMVGFVTSVSYTFSDDVAWEINQFNDSDLKKLPRNIEVGIEYTPISTYRPEFDSNLYDFIDNW